MKPKTVAEYIAAAPKPARKMLRDLRALLKKAAPKAMEALKWGSPVLIEKRILFAYTAYKCHINFMPTQSSLKPFKKELAGYVTGKDTVRFPYGEALPKNLIRKIAGHRVKDVRENGARWMER